MIFDVDECEKRIGYVFKDKMLLRKCFTHSSYANENNEQDNEVLEFFGDAVIEFVVTEFICNKYYGNEGKLTDIRKELVSEKPLLKAVSDLKIGEFMLLGKGQLKTSNGSEKLYSSLYEAVVAGIYLDGGIKAAKKFIKNTVIKNYEKSADFKKEKNKIADGKTKLQEYVQKYKIGSIAYETLSKKGPDHRPEFRVAVTLNGTRVAEGVGASKKLAESEAALRALEKLKIQREGK